jgi:regulatory protein
VADCVITSLEQVRPKGWFELIVEGNPPFLIDAESIFRHSLKIGDTLTETQINKIKNEADISWLKNKGMQILSRHMISERDLRRKLSEERRPQNAREDVIYQLKHYGLIDDNKYASSFVRTQISRGPKSRLYLKKLLREKGISEEIAQNAITSEFQEIDEVGAVRKLAEKKYKTVKYLPTEKAKGKVINFLRSRGFPWDTIRQAISGLFVASDDTENY